MTKNYGFMLRIVHPTVGLYTVGLNPVTFSVEYEAIITKNNGFMPDS